METVVYSGHYFINYDTWAWCPNFVYGNLDASCTNRILPEQGDYTNFLNPTSNNGFNDCMIGKLTSKRSNNNPDFNQDYGWEAAACSQLNHDQVRGLCRYACQDRQTCQDPKEYYTNYFTYVGPNFCETDLFLNADQTVSKMGIREIYSIGEDVFEFAPSTLNRLFLDTNYLKTLPEGVFRTLGNLTYLNLSQNNLGYLPETVFSKLANLEEINLAKNPIRRFPIGAFRDNTKLQNLMLIQNEFLSEENLPDLSQNLDLYREILAISGSFWDRGDVICFTL